MLRATPNVTVYRPADANETNHVFRLALENKTSPSVIVLSRQNLEVKVKTSYTKVQHGGYVIKDMENFQGILIATGSEVGLALDVQAALAVENIPVRVVSMPSVELFLAQPKSYQDKVLPPTCKKRLAIEMGASALWYRFADQVQGIDRFGVSATGEDATAFFGFDVATIQKRFKSL